MTTTLRARTPGDLLVLLPYLLGYHPRRSVVVAVMHGRRLGMVQRMDLSERPDHCAAIADQVLAVVGREGGEALLVAGYEDEPGSSRALRAAVVRAARRDRLPVFRDLVARDGRWYDESETPYPDSAPADGLPLPPVEEVPAVADLVRRGVAPMADRESFVAQTLPPPSDGYRAAGVAEQVVRRLERARDGEGPEWPSPAATTRVWRSILDPDPDAVPVADLPDAALAVAVASLADVRWRDALLAALGPGTMPTTALHGVAMSQAREATAACPWAAGGPEEDEGGPARPDGPAGSDASDVPDDEERASVLAVLGRLGELVGLVPEEAAPPVLTTIAHLAWWSGDGTLAGECLERALEIDPGYRLADLMHRLLSCGIRLRGWADDLPGAGALADEEPAA